MTNGWTWIHEGQRLAEQARGTDLEQVKAESLVFQDAETMALKTVQAEPAPAVGGFAGEFAELVKEVELCRAGHCAAAYKQNDVGGQARYVVQKIAQVVGLPLGDAIIGGNIWSPQNMARVIAAVQEMVNEQDVHRKELAARDGKDTKTVAALRDVLVSLGEAV
ncbi:hypothetical protein ABZ330_16745 [Streptomyces sp. NPDC006172]|uniref:hypothetical protein n=1 Tax=Streptomyces sp. NPDC006172 TaxID=3154470 RepID=UPI0033D276C5